MVYPFFSLGVDAGGKGGKNGGAERQRQRGPRNLLALSTPWWPCGSCPLMRGGHPLARQDLLWLKETSISAAL